MCGIVGYIGSKQAYPILIKGLKRLEYRGYDSAGVGLIGHESKLNVYKAKGKVSNLEDTASQKILRGIQVYPIPDGQLMENLARLMHIPIYHSQVISH